MPTFHLKNCVKKLKKNEPVNWDNASRNRHLNHRVIEHYHGSGQAQWDWKSMTFNRFSYHNSAVKIQRIFRKKGSFFRWKRAIKNVNNELMYNPYISYM